MKDINAEEYAALQNSETPVVIDFHATWCGPCKVLSPILEELEAEVVNVQFVKLDVDQFPEIAGANQVMGVPTVEPDSPSESESSDPESESESSSESSSMASSSESTALTSPSVFTRLT